MKSQYFEHVNKKFREKFIDEHGYLRCERCGVSSSFRFETHHIIFRSELGKNQDIHNENNLLLLCIECHAKFHSIKKSRNIYVKNRKLNELYGRNFII